MQRATGTRLHARALTALAALALAAPAAPQAAEEGLTVAAPGRALEPGHLRSLYLDLLGRPPLAAERERWAGAGRHAVLDEVLGTRAFWQHWLDEQLYHLLLIDNFQPHSERVLELPADLAAGRTDVRDALHRVALSAGFDRRNPGPDTFVSVVMEQLCGLEVQKNRGELEIGKALYDGDPGVFLGRSGNSQSDVVRIAIADRRFAETLVAREHARLVRAELDPRERRVQGRRVRKEPAEFLALLREWLLSPAYERRLDERAPLPNRLFVQALFVDLFDRPPAEDEAEALREALDGLGDSRPLRGVVTRMLLDSGAVPLPGARELADPRPWVADLVRRALGREASAAELDAFAAALAEPEARPETALLAVLTHPEYHRF